jgi:mono/diheme cytochrome c family protein
MKIGRLLTIRGQTEALTSARAMRPDVLRLIAIVASCLMLAACGQRLRDRPETAEPTVVTKGRMASGIEPIWKEPDRLAQAHLEGYGWVDRAAGIVHIPIERAMDLIVAEKKSSGPAPDQTGSEMSRGTDSALEKTGRQLMRQYGCTVCHDPDAVNHAPSLIGLYGQRVRLSDGTFVIAGSHYLHDSIMLSSKQVVAGYAPVMPDFTSKIPEPDVQELIAYIKSTSPFRPVSR